MEEEQVGEGNIEDYLTPKELLASHFAIPETLQEKKLTFDEASKGLNTLGKDESGVRYAYLMMTLTEKKLTDISIIANFKHLLFVDLSGNLLNLEALEVLTQLPFLIFLKAERNRIESASLQCMPYLQVLILNKNQITETGGLNQPLLETLELSDNSIYTAQFEPEKLSKLKVLSMSGNHLIDASGTYPTGLEKLFLGNNNISRINLDLSKLKNLKYLHLRDNNIRKLSGFTEQLSQLTYLNLRNNKINKIRQFRKLDCLPNLETIIVIENPACRKKDERDEDVEDEEHEDEIYGEEGAPSVDKTRLALLVLLPNLKRIDKEIVTAEEREAALLKKRQITEEIFEEDSSEDETEVPTTTDLTTEFTTETEIDYDLPRPKPTEVRGENESDN
ncbi:leucine-rich repeat-containing protein 23 [Leptinotarsa decemlineata]|uniref:leucine-rich repeat-containing protein 23 n=1 Tax=Leptinotarsa decemlineata TaxID=7539 RepID=UPI003D307062